MNGLGLLLVLATPGIDYGWKPGPDGQLEYIIQLEPQALDALRGGKEISSDVHPDVRSVRRIVLRVGEGEVERVAIPQQALEQDEESGDDQPPSSPLPRAGTTGGSRGNSRATQTGAQQPTRGPSATIQNNGAPRSGRSAPPLLNDKRRPYGASTAIDDEEDNAQTDGRFTLSDESAAEDPAGPYANVRPPSRYRGNGVANEQYADDENVDPNEGYSDDTGESEASQQPGVEEDGELWSRWNQGQQNANRKRWSQVPGEEQPEETRTPRIDARDLPPDPDAAWAQNAQPSSLGPNRQYVQDQAAPQGDRPFVQAPEVATRNTSNQGTYAAAGYSEAPTNGNTQQIPTNAGVNNSPSASDVPSTTAATAPLATTPAGGLFKELLLFVSLGVNVAAVIIARQYYLRYCMLVQEIRESESLAS